MYIDIGRYQDVNMKLEKDKCPKVLSRMIFILS